jgi:hypothetical protein
MKVKHVVASPGELPAELNLKRMPRVVMNDDPHWAHELRERKARRRTAYSYASA